MHDEETQHFVANLDHSLMLQNICYQENNRATKNNCVFILWQQRKILDWFVTQCPDNP